MKIMITGANGQLGRDLQEVLGNRYELFCFDLDLDVGDNQMVVSAISRIRPNIVIHAAAYTDVDGCESNIETAYRVNAIGAGNVAVGCQIVGAKMVYVSTDYIFDGMTSEPYLEFDDPNPQSVYGHSKLGGERLVSSLCGRHFIVRTAWLYGHHGNNFVKTILRLAKEKDELTVVNDQTGSPTYSYDLAEKIVEMAMTEKFGIYHVTNSGTCTWFDFAKLIIEYAGMDTKVLPVTTKEFPRPAPRPHYSVLRNMCLELYGFTPMRHYREALKAYFADGS